MVWRDKFSGLKNDNEEILQIDTYKVEKVTIEAVNKLWIVLSGNSWFRSFEFEFDTKNDKGDGLRNNGNNSSITNDGRIVIINFEKNGIWNEGQICINWVYC